MGGGLQCFIVYLQSRKTHSRLAQKAVKTLSKGSQKAVKIGLKLTVASGLDIRLFI